MLADIIPLWSPQGKTRQGFRDRASWRAGGLQLVPGRPRGELTGLGMAAGMYPTSLKETFIARHICCKQHMCCKLRQLIIVLLVVQNQLQCLRVC